MNILDYAIAKKLFGGSGSGEVSGTIEINENGTYNVAKYARANVNIPDTSGVAIEVSELPQASADTAGKVYFVDSKSAPKVGDVLGSKLYFDTTKNPMDYLANAGGDGNPVPILVADIDSQPAFQLMAMIQPIGDGYLCMLVGLNADYSGAFLYVDSNVLTVEQYNQEAAGQGMPPVTQFGWQVDEMDISPVTGATVSYAGDAAEVVQMDGGSAYYLGTEEKGSVAVGSPVGSKICFDTSVNIANLGIPHGEMVPVLTAQSDSASFGIVVGEILGGGSGLCYLVACGDISASDLSSVNIVYVQSDAPTVDIFNEFIGPQFGFTVTHFGWQTDVVDTSAYADCIVQENLLPMLGNFAYGGTEYSFEKANADTIANLQREKDMLQEQYDETHNWAAWLENNTKALYIPADTIITNGMLAGCTGIEKISFAQHKPYDLSNAFGGKDAVPNSLKTLELIAETLQQNEFKGYNNLTTVIISGVKFWNRYIFSECENLENVIISNSDYIGIYTFNYCNKLTNVIIENSVTKLETGAFGYCNGLKSIVVPDSVTEISAYAFRECSNLVEVAIGTGITKMSYYVFKDSENLARVTIKATTPPSIETDTFDGCTALTAIYVPAESVEAYKSATNWSAYADKIQAIVE